MGSSSGYSLALSRTTANFADPFPYHLRTQRAASALLSASVFPMPSIAPLTHTICSRSGHFSRSAFVNFFMVDADVCASADGATAAPSIATARSIPTYAKPFFLDTEGTPSCDDPLPCVRGRFRVEKARFPEVPERVRRALNKGSLLPSREQPKTSATSASPRRSKDPSCSSTR